METTKIDARRKGDIIKIITSVSMWLDEQGAQKLGDTICVVGMLWMFGRLDVIENALSQEHEMLAEEHEKMAEHMPGPIRREMLDMAEQYREMAAEQNE